MDPLSVAEVKDLIQAAETSTRHEDCLTCECYLGYLTQLGMDADPEARSYLENLQPSKDQVHSCLGCDPCPPGVLHSTYLRKRNKPLEGS